jgi:hypothetical protein
MPVTLIKCEHCEEKHKARGMSSHVGAKHGRAVKRNAHSRDQEVSDDEDTTEHSSRKVEAGVGLTFHI